MSSIFDDKKLVQLLTVAGANHINKYGQDNFGPDPNKLIDYNIADKLLVNLARAIAPNDPNTPKAGSPIGIAGGDPNATVGIKPKNLKNLGDLLNWVLANNITWNGKPFVWANQAAAQSSGEEPMPIDVLSGGDRRERNPANRQPVSNTIYVSKKPLLEFLVMLRDSEEAKNDAVFRVMIGKSINQVNDFLDDDEKIDRNAKGKGAPATNLPDTFVVDGFPGPVLDVDNITDGADKAPRFENMNVQLTLGHLKSKGALAQFLRNMKIKKQGKEHFVFDPKNPDPCTAVYVLYRRSQYLAQIADDAEVKGYTQAVKLYQTKILEIGRTFTVVGEDGQEKPCAVTAPSAGGQQPGQQPGQQQGGANAAQTQQMLHDVVRYMPLRSENFDFTRIEAFFEAYERLLLGTQSPQLSYVQQAKGTVHTARQEISSECLKDSGMINFPMSGGASTVVQWLQPPQYENYLPFVQKMMAALEATKNAISMFYSAYVDPANGNRAGLTSEERGIVSGQFMGDSYYQRNRWAMNKWLNTSGEVTGLKR